MLDISSFSNSLKIFQEKLDALFKSRHSLAEQDYPIDFVGDGGLVLYEIALDEICRILSFIKKHFPEEVGESELFKFIDDPTYQDIFKKKFYKFFVDREICDEGLEYPSHQFNRSNFEDNIRGADLCYAEGFAIGFFLMLNEVLKKFEKDRVEKEKSKISDEDFLRLLASFNNSVTGTNHDVRSDTGYKFGASVTHLDLEERKVAQNQFGENKVFYNFISCEFVTFLGPDFEAKRCGVSYYQSFLKKMSEAGSDKPGLLFEMADWISSATHISADANTRSAILFGWMMAIIQGEVFPIGIYQNFADKRIIEEAKDWTKRFLANPGEVPFSAESQTLFTKTLDQNIESSVVEDMAVTFISDLLVKEHGGDDIDVFFEIPLTLDHALFVGESAIVDDAIVITQNLHHPFKEDACRIMDFSELSKAIEANQEELAQEKDIEKRNAKIAFYFLKYVAMDLKDYRDGSLRTTLTSTLNIYDHAEENKEMAAIVHENLEKFSVVRRDSEELWEEFLQEKVDLEVPSGVSNEANAAAVKSLKSKKR